MLAAVRAQRPHVVVVFRPETVPAGLFEGLEAATLGFLTEPLPRAGNEAHPDLEWRLSELVLGDPHNFDRLVCFDPRSAPAADAHARVWRSLPLPVDDRFFARRRPLPGSPCVLFLGYSTAHRERFLMDVKHYHDVLHVAHGVSGEGLLDLFARTDVAINLHGHPYPTFENRVCLHLAAGQLVVSEPLHPTHGLEPGIDFLEVREPWQLQHAISAIRAAPEAYETVRRRGRRKAETYRASRVWPRLLGDLLLDLRAFGSSRTSAQE